ncbi:TetR/AcrR family transcriptional regulator [Actinoalloteichus hymeniacidonis]|uniref:Transcriptional regulator, TetR family n=1 Tax=Actinoalloteichus hymeniacidonis TaxID=340345 RepID=A0AAC9HMS4_9PSEU|nr:TetR/AcrR family transcriptional regulator [Actinoalloteichus hymeniacidonis]AOS62194.1 transcriptional regulator, TetR family [Actinoalloteichus hymeniacidonis]MBB5909781.1 AcrR family transcriptional regulator [Actinoalloteichus hymeniacidonis]
MAEISGTPRERYRAQVREEIKSHAWEQIATAGASALSLNAIAKQMGMSGPALYRYFVGRDELITALIKDAYRDLADTFAEVAAADPAAGPPALARAMRRWVLADPQRYLLIYGTPVPGYHAPPDVTAIAGEIMYTLLDVCMRVPTPRPSTEFTAHLADHRSWAADHPATPATIQLALNFWTRLHGLLSLEIAGHFTGMEFDADLLFAAEVDELSER